MAKGLISVTFEIVPEKIKKSGGVPIIEDGLALKLIDSISKRCFQKFGLRADSKVVFEELQKKFREEVVLAIAEVFAIVPDGYKKRGK